MYLWRWRVRLCSSFWNVNFVVYEKLENLTSLESVIRQYTILPVFPKISPHFHLSLFFKKKLFWHFTFYNNKFTKLQLKLKTKFKTYYNSSQNIMKVYSILLGMLGLASANVYVFVSKRSSIFFLFVRTTLTSPKS